MTNHAVVLGIDRYATDLESLEGAVADAHDFASWLVSSGEVAPANLRLGLHPGRQSPPLPPLLQACATVGTTVDELDVLLGTLVDTPQPDAGRFYFFFSGHGASASNPVYAEEAICLQGYTERLTKHALEVSSLLAVLNGIAAEERFILIDGCRDAVFRDDVLFGRLSRKPRAARGVRRNYVLRATGPGRMAAEVDGRGLFSRHLCSGLRGAGAAKRWDPDANANAGGYVVRWSALVEHVFAAVAQEHASARDEQLIYEEGEHPANRDPQFAAFPEGHFGFSTVAVRLVEPVPPPQSTMVHLRRNSSADPDRSQPVPASCELEFSIRPSTWVLWADAQGWRSRPKAVDVYVPQLRQELTLVREPSGPAPGELLSPAWDAARSMVAAPPADGQVRFSVGGRPLGEIQPSVRVAVRRESGEVVADPVTQDSMSLAPGVYRVRLDVGGARWDSAETVLLVEAGQVHECALPLPDVGTTALYRTLDAGHKPLPSQAFAWPSEAMGPLAGTSAATVASLAVVQAVQGYRQGLADLQIGRRWLAGAETGVEVLVVDERDGASGPAPQRARLWRMRVPGTKPVSGELKANLPDVPVVSTSLGLSTGGYWLQLRDADRKRRAGSKLATQVLPGHVTLVVRNPTPSGVVALLQFAIRQDPGRRVEIQSGVVQGEALQRARAAGRDPLVDPTVLGLAQGRWFEPFSALVAASALLERREEGRELFLKVLAALDAHGIGGPDVAVLQAARAALGDDDEAAAHLVEEALRMRQAPIVEALLERLDGEAKRLGFTDGDAAWIEAKLQETVGHPLWTLRREDDVRRSGTPDAAGRSGLPGG